MKQYVQENSTTQSLKERTKLHEHFFSRGTEVHLIKRYIKSLSIYNFFSFGTEAMAYKKSSTRAFLRALIQQLHNIVGCSRLSPIIFSRTIFPGY